MKHIALIIILTALAFAGCQAAPLTTSGHPRVSVKPSARTFGLQAALVDPATPAVGEVANTSHGTWTGTPTSYAYAWQRCNPSCATITGQAASSYTIQLADVGYTLQSVVTATNAAGSATASSAPTGVVHNFASSLPAPLASPAPLSTASTTTSTALSTSLSGLSAGEQLCLHAGTYGTAAAAVTLSSSGTSAHPITIESCAGELATIAQRLDVTGDYIRLSGLKIVANSTATDTRSPSCPGGGPTGNVGIWFTGGAGAHDTLENSEVTGTTMSGILGDSTATNDQFIDDYIHVNGSSSDDHGIYWAGNNLLVENSIFAGNAAFGVQIDGGGSGSIIANNTLYHNGIGDSTCLGSGLVTFNATSGLLVVNNLAVSNTDVGYKTYDTGNTLSHDLAYSNTNGSTGGSGSWTGSVSLTSNPLLNTSTFALGSGSPAVGAGDPAYTPVADYNGQRRTNADLGAVAGP